MSMTDAFKLAGRQIGLNETQQSAAIQDYLTTGGANLDPATTAWCAAFVNSTLGQTGMAGTGSNMARSFLDWGAPVDTPQQGDIAVFSRGDPDGPYGHVGFFAGYNPDGTIRVLGGNQGAEGAVSIANYDPSRLLGFRRAPGAGAAPPTQNALAPPQPEPNRLQLAFARQDPAAFQQQRNPLAFAPVVYDRRNVLGSLT